MPSQLSSTPLQSSGASGPAFGSGSGCALKSQVVALWSSAQTITPPLRHAPILPSSQLLPKSDHGSSIEPSQSLSMPSQRRSSLSMPLGTDGSKSTLSG